MKTPINNRVILSVMAMFNGTELVFKIDGLTLGEFDPSAEGFYKNVQTFAFKVKKRRAIRMDIKADVPVDIAVADENGSSVSYKQAVKEGMIGPFPTEGNREMGMILGIHPGDKATVSVEVWMERS
ncbi:MAG: hypothetical protein FWG96_06955 [Methanomassiliicoccaceae archaeon]|nr:hypothetical protein [Methanomassiliicoccaceae archaeon]